MARPPPWDWLALGPVAGNDPISLKLHSAMSQSETAADHTNARLPVFEMKTDRPFESTDSPSLSCAGLASYLL